MLCYVIYRRSLNCVTWYVRQPVMYQVVPIQSWKKQPRCAGVRSIPARLHRKRSDKTASTRVEPLVFASFLVRRSRHDRRTRLMRSSVAASEPDRWEVSRSSASLENGAGQFGKFYILFRLPPEVT